MFSCEICEIFKNNSFLKNSSSGCFWRLTRIFKGVRIKAVVRKCLFCNKDVLKNFAKFTKNTCARVFFLRKLQRCFLVNFAKFLSTLFFTEHLRWLLLSGTKTGASASDKYSPRFNWKKNICCHENQHEEDNSWIFLCFYFRILNFLNFAMTKWFCPAVTCFLMFFQDIFIIKKLFYNVVQTSSETLSFFHR